jgi:ArsR family transcriptional regulator
MKALSDKNRLKIVKLLQHRELCVCEIQSALGVSQPTVSKHLKILVDAEIVRHRKDGQWVNYGLSNGADNRYVSVLLGNIRHWVNDDPEISALVERLPQIHREKICGT